MADGQPYKQVSVVCGAAMCCITLMNKQISSMLKSEEDNQVKKLTFPMRQSLKVMSLIS